MNSGLPLLISFQVPENAHKLPAENIFGSLVLNSLLTINLPL